MDKGEKRGAPAPHGGVSLMYTVAWPPCDLPELRRGKESSAFLDWLMHFVLLRCALALSRTYLHLTPSTLVNSPPPAPFCVHNKFSDVEPDMQWSLSLFHPQNRRFFVVFFLFTRTWICRPHKGDKVDWINVFNTEIWSSFNAPCECMCLDETHNCVQARFYVRAGGGNCPAPKLELYPPNVFITVAVCSTTGWHDRLWTILNGKLTMLELLNIY